MSVNPESVPWRTAILKVAASLIFRIPKSLEK